MEKQSEKAVYKLPSILVQTLDKIELPVRSIKINSDKRCHQIHVHMIQIFQGNRLGGFNSAQE